METTAPAYQATPRSGMLITMGILALIIFGPLLGIPGWIMSNQDIRDAGLGILPSAETSRLRVGRILNILGTFLSPIWLFIYGVCLFVLVVVLFAFLGALM
jgi:hypothetical protein